MTTITASAVNKLRQMTGAGMMDCKKALQESNGEMDGAVDILRKKGAAKAAKRADRDAAEGLSIAKSSDDNTYGIVVEVNCETDFVAKNDDFVAFANQVADFALTNQFADKDALLGAAFEGKTLGEICVDKTAVIGEKVEVSNYALLSSEGVAAYNHGANRIGVLVALNSASDDALQAGRDLAMQIAAMNPIAVDENAVSQEVKDKVWNRDGGKCVECGSNENLEFDHIIPHSKGGANTYRNIQLLCEPCNRSKSAKIG